MSRQWRPSLAFVLGGALAGTLALSFAGLVTLRYLGPYIGFRNAAMLLAALIAIATAVLWWLLVRLLLRPIRALEAYALAQEAGGGATPPGHFGTRELHATGNRVIAMAESLREREATIRSYTDHVTHELKTPVAGIRAAVELMEDGQALNDQDAKLLAEIDGARLQIEAQLSALRRAAQAREAHYRGQSRLVDIAQTLSEDYSDLAISYRGEERSIPLANEGLIIVLAQLLRNAGEHGASAVSLSLDESAGRITLLVEDNGRGISAGNAGRIFEPFFTTRRETGGTGMGLTIVRNILAAHNGKIALIPSDIGTKFQITFR